MQKLILPDLIDIGNISPHRIERIAQIYADLGLVPENYSLQGFIYNPTKDNGTIRTIISALSIALTVAAFIGVILVLFNSRLKKQVAEQTKELRTSTSLLKTVIEGTTDAIFLKNLQGQYLLANNSTLKAIGKSEAEVIGKTDNELFSEDSSIPMNKFDQSVLQSGVSKTAEERLTTSYGDSYWLTTKTTYRDQEGNIIGLIGVSRNITELKRVEEEKKALQKHLAQAQKMESIGTLAGGIAHDFNNILSSVLGYTELALQDAEENSEQQSHLKQVLTAGNRAKDLVRQILAVARKSDEEIKPLKLGKLVSEVIKFIRSTTPTTIEIVQSIENNSPIMASPTQMHQVLMNLCTNATHAMQENGGVLEVTLNDVAYTNELRTLGLDPNIDIYIKLTVSDTGTGIDPAIMENIFEPYFTTKGIGGGTGLGLAMVKGIIEGYGGQIRVTSIPDQKTTFTVYLPTTTQKISKDYHHKSPPQRGDEHILIVDDEPAVAKMESEILGSLGYTVTTKTDSRESLEFFKKESNGIDLVITDMTMPQITGDILATELRKIRPEIPIILCTGYSSRINKESAKDLGINAFIDKPFSQSDIADVIRNVLDGSDQSR